MATGLEQTSLISIRELSNRWKGMGKQTIWNKCKSGDIPARKIGQNWFIEMDYVLATEGKKNDSLV